MPRVTRLLACLIAAPLLIAHAPAARAGLDLEEGHWRVELATTYGIHSGTTNRSGNVLTTGTVEYEIPATPRTTLGLRLMPLFLYTQDDTSIKDSDDWYRLDEEDASDTVWGGGLGLTGRIYQVKDEYRGWYGEAEGLAVVHDNKIIGNSSNFNFLIGLGVGYKFKSHWHTVLKYEHISNSSIGARNAGANSLGLGLGYSF
ncbi:MAG: acyloxyacyl hydrolase [Candidatus Hydrogenedentes bacterium]|nr:acyloxyacyl hydrolase [Candidatus Hydrogenedentota bacterium]